MRKRLREKRDVALERKGRVSGVQKERVAEEYDQTAQPRCVTRLSCESRNSWSGRKPFSFLTRDTRESAIECDPVQDTTDMRGERERGVWEVVRGSTGHHAHKIRRHRVPAVETESVAAGRLGQRCHRVRCAEERVAQEWPWRTRSLGRPKHGSQAHSGMGQTPNPRLPRNCPARPSQPGPFRGPGLI